MGTKSPQSMKKSLGWYYPTTYWLISMARPKQTVERWITLHWWMWWCIYFGLIPKLSWPMQIYEVSITKVEAIEQLISKYMKKGWEYLTPKQMWHYTVH